MVPVTDTENEFGEWQTNEVTFVPAGASPPNPSAVLESAAFRSLLEHVANNHDVVVIDTSPLTAVSDVIPLLPHVNAVVLVARSGTTDRRSARHAAEVIGRVPGVNFVGIAVNDLPVAEATAYGAGYGYGYGYVGFQAAR
jgi:Mrp family chromosome partitioning ATPase